MTATMPHSGTRLVDGALAATWIIGAYAMAFGILLVVLSFKIKKMAER